MGSGAGSGLFLAEIHPGHPMETPSDFHPIPLGQFPSGKSVPKPAAIPLGAPHSRLGPFPPHSQGSHPILSPDQVHFIHDEQVDVLDVLALLPAAGQDVPLFWGADDDVPFSQQLQVRAGLPGEQHHLLVEALLELLVPIHENLCQEKGDWPQVGVVPSGFVRKSHRSRVVIPKMQVSPTKFLPN